MGWLIWFLLLLAALVVLQGWYYRDHARSRLSYRRSLDKRTVDAGDTVILEEEVFNDKLIPLPWLRTEYDLSAWLRLGEDKTVTSVDERRCRSVFQPGSYSRITRQHTVTCLRRGVYSLGRVSLSAGDLLGLSIQYWNYDEPLELTVYPRPIPLAELPQTALQWQGAVMSRRWISPDPILVGGLRDYQPGDSRRDVHWKATARAGELQVKVHDYTVQPRVLVALNITPIKGFWGSFSEKQNEELEYAVSLAATLAAWAWQKGMAVGFLTNAEGCEGFLPPMRCAGQLDRILRALAQLRSRERCSFSAALQEVLEKGVVRTDVLALSAWWDTGLERQARQLRRRSNALTRLDVQKGGMASCG